MNRLIRVTRCGTAEMRDLSRHRRRHMTEPERIVWQMLRRRACKGYSFRRQQVILGFIVDFYCVHKKLAVEIDGSIHDFRQDYDHERSSILGSYGITVIRFTNEEVVADPNAVFECIARTLDTLPTVC